LVFARNSATDKNKNDGDTSSRVKMWRGQTVEFVKEGKNVHP